MKKKEMKKKKILEKKMLKQAGMPDIHCIVIIL